MSKGKRNRDRRREPDAAGVSLVEQVFGHTTSWINDCLDLMQVAVMTFGDHGRHATHAVVHFVEGGLASKPLDHVRTLLAFTVLRLVRHEAYRSTTEALAGHEPEWPGVGVPVPESISEEGKTAARDLMNTPGMRTLITATRSLEPRAWSRLDDWEKIVDKLLVKHGDNEQGAIAAATLFHKDVLDGRNEHEIYALTGFAILRLLRLERLGITPEALTNYEQKLA